MEIIHIIEIEKIYDVHCTDPVGINQKMITVIMNCVGLTEWNGTNIMSKHNEYKV